MLLLKWKDKDISDLCKITQMLKKHGSVCMCFENKFSHIIFLKIVDESVMGEDSLK